MIQPGSREGINRVCLQGVVEKDEDEPVDLTEDPMDVVSKVSSRQGVVEGPVACEWQSVLPTPNVVEGEQVEGPEQSVLPGGACQFNTPFKSIRQSVLPTPKEVEDGNVEGPGQSVLPGGTYKSTIPNPSMWQSVLPTPKVVEDEDEEGPEQSVLPGGTRQSVLPTPIKVEYNVEKGPEQSVLPGDFRWSEGADKKIIQTEKDIARQFWLRWRREQRSKIISKKRSRRGILVDSKTTSMEPPGMVEDVLPATNVDCSPVEEATAAVMVDETTLDVEVVVEEDARAATCNGRSLKLVEDVKNGPDDPGMRDDPTRVRT